jgi:hypothetical protein
MVQRFTSACDARARTSSSSSFPPSSASASASGAAAAAAFESSFDNLDLLFGGESAGIPCEADDQNEKGFKASDSEANFDIEGQKDKMKVYFPELCLGDALEVGFGVFCVKCGPLRAAPKATRADVEPRLSKKTCLQEDALR